MPSNGYIRLTVSKLNKEETFLINPSCCFFFLLDVIVVSTNHLTAPLNPHDTSKTIVIETENTEIVWPIKHVTRQLGQSNLIAAFKRTKTRKLTVIDDFVAVILYLESRNQNYDRIYSGGRNFINSVVQPGIYNPRTVAWHSP